MNLTQFVRDAGLDARGAVLVNRLALGRAVQTPLQFGEELGRLVLLAGCDQRQEFFLGQTSFVQKETIDHSATEGSASLFGGGSSISHKGKECPKDMASVNQ